MAANDPKRALAARAVQEGEEERPGKRKIRTVRVVDGMEVEEEIWVDATEGPEWKPRAEMRLIDHDCLRVDAAEKLTGAARYTHDIRLPDMVWGRLVLCPVPRAFVSVDVEPALDLPGVVTAQAIVSDAETSYLGQPIAVVAAETPEAAEDAARAIWLEMEELPWSVTPEQAAQDGAPSLRDEGNWRASGEDGDPAEVEAAFAECSAVVEATYTMPVQHHVCLETHGVVVDYRGGDEATIYASTQFTFGPLREAAGILGLKQSQVRCLVHHMGGGFGSKFSLDVPGKWACELAKELKRPVHLMLDRPQEFAVAGNRSGGSQTLKAGATADGRMQAFAADVVTMGGIGGGSSARQPYIYVAGKTFRRTRALHTMTDSSRAMRAPGHPQASFAMESVVDELAYALGMDPLEFRIANLEDEVYHRQLRRVAQEIGWHDHPNRTAPGSGDGWEAVGIGFGVSTWGGGGGPSCEVDVRIEQDGSVTSSVGSQDLGTGTKTYVASIVAEELGLPLEAVEPRIGDSRFGRANPSGGSTTAASLAPSVKHAAHLVRVAFAEHLGGVMALDPARLAFRDGKVVDLGDESTSMHWKTACKTLPAEGLEQRGTWQQSLSGSGVHGAQAARVRVDLMTGAVQVLKMACVQDCGLPLNTLALRSQFNGGMIGALSYALFEERVIDPDLGLLMNANLEDYKIAGCLEMPEFVSIVDEEDTRQQVIGIGEPPAIPGAGVIANAVFNACGLRIRDLPITPQRVLDALAQRS